MGREHLRRKRANKDVVFGNSLLHSRADLNRPIFPRIGSAEAAVGVALLQNLSLICTVNEKFTT